MPVCLGDQGLVGAGALCNFWRLDTGGGCHDFFSTGHRVRVGRNDRGDEEENQSTRRAGFTAMINSNIIVILFIHMKEIHQKHKILTEFAKFSYNGQL